MARVGGIIFIKANGTQYRAKGNFTYNLGRLKKEKVVGSDGVHGTKVVPQVPFIEGAITDQGTCLQLTYWISKGQLLLLSWPTGKSSPWRMLTSAERATSLQKREKLRLVSRAQIAKKFELNS